MSLIHVVCYDLICCVTNTISVKNTQPRKYPLAEYFHCRPRKRAGKLALVIFFLRKHLEAEIFRPENFCGWKILAVAPAQ